MNKAWSCLFTTTHPRLFFFFFLACWADTYLDNDFLEVKDIM